MKPLSLLMVAFAIQCIAFQVDAGQSAAQVGPAPAPALPSPATPPVLIRDATVHTMTSAGVLEHTDILISDGKIAEMGHGLNALRAPRSSTLAAAR